MFQALSLATRKPKQIRRGLSLLGQTQENARKRVPRCVCLAGRSGLRELGADGWEVWPRAKRGIGVCRRVKACPVEEGA